MSIGASGCAEGGLPTDDGNDNQSDQSTGQSGDGGKTPARDAGKDSRVSTSDDSNTDDSNTGGGGTTIKDAGGGGTTIKDAGGGGTTVKDAGSGGGGTSTAIKCPSPLICSNSIGAALALFGAKVGASDNLCASSGTLGLPMGVSCTTDDTCKSSRLTSATCQSGYCIQPCTP